MGSAEGSGQQDALLLAAGQVAVAALGKLRDAELCEKLFGVLLLRLAVKWTQTVCGEEAAADDFLTGRRKILLEGSLLRQIADLPRGESIAEGDLTFERRYESEQSFDQCRLTGTDSRRRCTDSHRG